jgi:homocitrate synthase
MGLDNFCIIESTLREGSQYFNGNFTSEQKFKIVELLDTFGVEYIEVTSPVASERSKLDCISIFKIKRNKSKILTHIRCHMDDAKVAVECGVDGIDLVFGTSSYLREFSHGKDIDYIIKSATEVINFIRSKNSNIEIRFSSEDSFRSDFEDLKKLYTAINKLNINRVGIADTIGISTPLQVYKLVSEVRKIVDCDIEFHAHNDTDCSVGNSYCALEAGATHIDTSILGIGERNGITSLGAFIARMYVYDKETLKKKYKLEMIKEIENYVASIIGVEIPFNSPITGVCSFSHSAGIHIKGMLNNPSTYEIINPQDFGMTRYINIGSVVGGWNGVKHRADQLNLGLTDDQIKEVSTQIKKLADIKTQSLDDVDSILQEFTEKIKIK